MKLLRRYPLLISMMLVLVFSLSAGIETDLYPRDGEGIREVCRDGIAYIPPGTKYVKCNGKVKKILRITPLMEDDESCLCPKCCGGECGIIVSCGSFPELAGSETDTEGYGLDEMLESGQITLCILWIYCDYSTYQIYT